MCHANDQSWREVLELISNCIPTQLQSARAQLKNRTDGAAELLLRPRRPGDAPTPAGLCRSLHHSCSWALIISHHLQSGYSPLMLISFCVKKKKYYFCFDSLCAHIHYINAMELNFTILTPCLFLYMESFPHPTSFYCCGVDKYEYTANFIISGERLHLMKLKYD